MRALAPTKRGGSMRDAACDRASIPDREPNEVGLDRRQTLGQGERSVLHAARVEKAFEGQAALLLPGPELSFGGVVLADVPRLVDSRVIIQPFPGFFAGGAAGIAYKQHICLPAASGDGFRLVLADGVHCVEKDLIGHALHPYTRLLLRSVIERARNAGVAHLVLSTQPIMVAAQRLYASEGFVRLPERDWSPQPGVPLLAYGLRLSARGQE